MTLSQLALICAGFSLNAATFVLGVMVGLSLSRKDSHDRNSNEATEGSVSRQWHLPTDRSAPCRPGCGAGRCSKPKPEADPVERFAGKRRDHGE
jgi:hypothetical protein